MALPYGQNDGVGTVAGGQLLNDGCQVLLDCLKAHIQGVSDSLVCLASGDLGEHLCLSWSQWRTYSPTI